MISAINCLIGMDLDAKLAEIEAKMDSLGEEIQTSCTDHYCRRDILPVYGGPGQCYQCDRLDTQRAILHEQQKLLESIRTKLDPEVVERPEKT